MKKVLLAATYVLLAACSQNTGDAHNHNDHEHHNHEGHDHEGHDHEGHDHEAHTSKVMLNDGKKWKANVETTEGIANMLTLIHEYDASAEPESYEDLQEKLQAEFRDIFKKCTMTGEAHDQLHNYLLPLKEKLEKVTEENLYDIESYLHTYSEYFM